MSKKRGKNRPPKLSPRPPKVARIFVKPCDNCCEMEPSAEMVRGMCQECVRQLANEWLPAALGRGVCL